MTTTTIDHKPIRADLQDLSLALKNVWFEIRPVLTTRGRVERDREADDRRGFERGRAFERAQAES